jgi:hypothetical protein
MSHMTPQVEMAYKYNICIGKLFINQGMPNRNGNNLFFSFTVDIWKLKLMLLWVIGVVWDISHMTSDITNCNLKWAKQYLKIIYFQKYLTYFDFNWVASISSVILS